MFIFYLPCLFILNRFIPQVQPERRRRLGHRNVKKKERERENDYIAWDENLKLLNVFKKSFNVDNRREGFSLIRLAEYARMLFIRILF